MATQVELEESPAGTQLPDEEFSRAFAGGAACAVRVTKNWGRFASSVTRFINIPTRSTWFFLVVNRITLGEIGKSAHLVVHRAKTVELSADRDVDRLIIRKRACSEILPTT